MADVRLTKDQDRAVCMIYGEYLNRVDNGTDKDEAQDFTVADIEQLFAGEKMSNIQHDISGLVEKFDMRMYISGSFSVNDDLIIYMETRFKRGLKEVLDYLSSAFSIVNPFK